MANDKLNNAAKIVGAVSSAMFSESGRKFLCGTYSDGSPRSLSDALNGEFISPEKKEKLLKKAKKRKKGKKKNKKNKFDLY